MSLNTALDYLDVKQYVIEIQAKLTYKTATLFSKPGTLTVNVKWVDRAPTISIAPTVTVMSEDVVGYTYQLSNALLIHSIYEFKQQFYLCQFVYELIIYIVHIRPSNWPLGPILAPYGQGQHVGLLAG